MNLSKSVAIATMAAFFTLGALAEPAHAGRTRWMGQNGAAGKFRQTGQYGSRAGVRGAMYGQGAFSAQGGQAQGPNGGMFKRGGLNAIGQQGAFHGSGSAGTGPNGGNYQRAGATGVNWENGTAAHASGFTGTSANGSTLDRGSKWNYQQGVGGQSQKGFDYVGANGNSATGYKTNNYDAASGSGTMTKGRDFNTKDGQSYGYDKTTDYAKGEGVTTTVDRQNGQDYTVQYQKGQKPVYTPVPTEATAPVQ